MLSLLLPPNDLYHYSHFSERMQGIYDTVVFRKKEPVPKDRLSIDDVSQAETNRAVPRRSNDNRQSSSRIVSGDSPH